MENVLKLPHLVNDSKNVKIKRNLDNSEIIKHFGKGKLNIWRKDLETGKDNFDFGWMK